MDTSEQYIKMCEKAKEIQGQRWGHITDDNFWDNQRLPWAVWLPRQDQLQEMVKEKFTGWTYPGVLNKLQKFCFEISYYNSMEQLWLAFVMKEKYSKVWDGENWIKK